MTDELDKYISAQNDELAAWKELKSYEPTASIKCVGVGAEYRWLKAHPCSCGNGQWENKGQMFGSDGDTLYRKCTSCGSKKAFRFDVYSKDPDAYGARSSA